jgi:superfamily II DNA or RNA helicase
VLVDEIEAVLAEAPGRTASEVAAALGVGKGERAVSFALFSHHGRFRCDHWDPPRWWLVSHSSRGSNGPGSLAGGAQAGLAGFAGGPQAGLAGFAGGPQAGLAGGPQGGLAGGPQGGLAGGPQGGLAGGPQGRGGPPENTASLTAPVAPFPLYQWQADALAAWDRRHRRGVVEAVTGTGKTVVGIAAALQEIRDREQVLVLVPTVELQRQWVDELTARLPARTLIGRLGDGAHDRLASHDVLVAVVNSARAIDVRPIRRGGLLVADECHRYGSAVNQLALDRRFTHRLGLSATYGRDDDGNREWLDPYFGGTCFQMGYRRALADEVTAHFNVALVGVQFSTEERDRYRELTLLMGQQRARLIDRYGVPPEPFEAFMAAVNALADGDGGGSGVARTYRTAMLERRRLLADTPAKDAAVARLAPAISGAERAIVFTQSIAASERIAWVLGGHGLRAGVVHSEMSGPHRRSALVRFESGELQVISAPRVLDEGIDVPAADLAVIAGASHSRRQMVQRMGRVLRRKADGRRARFAVLYVEATVEDPQQGAHEAFLDEMVDVAEEVRWFPAEIAARDPAGVCDFLTTSSTGVPQPMPRLAQGGVDG